MATLTGFSMPSVIDLSAGHVPFTISASAVDPDGIGRVIVWFDRDVTYNFGSSSTGGTWSLFGFYGIYDSWADGSASEQHSFLSTNSSGRVDILRITVEDRLGNETTYTTDDLRTLGFMTGFDIVGSAPAPIQGAYARVSVNDSIQITEGTSRTIDLGFLNLTNHSFQWEYSTTTAGGTASASDLGATSGSGSMSIWSTSPVTRGTSISISALQDGIREATETGYLTIRLVGGLTFDDGGTMRVIRIDVIDDNMTTGGAGNDRLRGTAAAETLAGGMGNDTYHVTAGDRVVEAANAGIDTVHSALTRWLDPNVENLTLTGTAAINGTGNALANMIRGNAAANLLNGGAGADTLAGGLGNDIYVVDGADTVVETLNGGTDLVQSAGGLTLAANVENLTLTGAANVAGVGNALANVIRGNAGMNRLDGTTGADTLAGGLGDDTYVTDGGDTIVEGANGGMDRVLSSASIRLAANVETLVLTGGGAISGTGNLLANAITGNAAANALSGDAGDDTLTGGAGADTLTGGAGRDVLAGGAGNDVLVTDGHDMLVEHAGGGVDEVRSTASLRLGANLEHLALTGTAAINGTGNALANAITGNAAANILSGDAGNDSLSGGAGADSLIGGAGRDMLIGGLGADRFVFNAASESGLDFHRDVVADFARGSDLIDLRGIDANGALAGNQAFAFGGATAVRNGVWYADIGADMVVRGDVNGDGVRDFEMQLRGVGALSAADFLL
ncbi:calcium-binding protein [Paracoccus luteus]|uniref:calcium-binding protein n=1 Tax=Paracoccus luteus TaxID=2508543 RepID=UPI0010702F6C|nr:calcium-binding protein [Paracoccus luteus]